MRRWLLIAALAALAACAGTQPTTAGRARDGILVMAHGGDAAWNQHVLDAVAPLEATMPVEVAFGMALPSSIEAAAKKLEAQGVTRAAVVRLFVSGESWTEETEYILGLRATLADERHAAHANMKHGGGHEMEAPQPIESSITFAMSRQGLSDSPVVDAILADRVRALSNDPSREAVLFLAHGPGDDSENERWLRRMEERAQATHAIGPFRAVQCATLREDWPEKRKLSEARIRAFVEEQSAAGARVIVVPFRVVGFGPYKKVLDGLPYVADEKGFVPHPQVTEWIRSTAQTLLASARNTP